MKLPARSNEGRTRASLRLLRPGRRTSVSARARTRRLALGVVVLLGLVAVPGAAWGQGWYDSNWQYRKKITIDHTLVAGNLSDFPVLLNFTDTDLRDKARNDGFDILFTEDDGTTKLDHDIESYVGSSGALVAWVEVTSLSSSVDTDIYMYYGYSSASDQEAESSTWSDSYVAVYHLHDDFDDASGNQGAGTNSGSADVSGIAGDGQNFVRNEHDYIDTNWAPSSFTGDYTFEGWFRALGQNSTGDLIGVEDRGTGDDSEIRLAIRDDDSNGAADGWDIELRSDGGGDIISADGPLPGDPDDGNWHHLAIVRQGNRGRIYYDGVWITIPDSSTASGTASFPSPRTILLGAQWDTDGGGPPATRNWMDGDLDELRIHTTARTQPYFATEVANLNNSTPGGFYDLPDPEENPPVGGNVLMIVSSSSSPSSTDQSMAAYLESRGLTVFYADDDQTAANYQSSIDTNNIDAVYVSQSCGSSKMGSKTKNLTAGVVMANGGNWEDNALAGHDNEDAATTVQITDNTHFITQEYALGSLTIYSSSGVRAFGENGFGSGAQVLATTGSSGEATLIVYEQGASLEDNSTAVNRRVGIWEEEPTYSRYTADNLNLVYRSLIWAGGLDSPAPGDAVTSATAEISPNDVQTSATGVPFVYAILATISGTDTGVDSVEITVPSSFGLPVLDSVRVGGSLATITDNTSGRTISFNLSTKLTSSDSIQAYFTADAPTSSDPSGVDFTSTVDDRGTATAPQSTTEGNADGDAGDANSWTVTTSGDVSSALAEISPNDVLTSSTAVEFIYAILATIGAGDSGVDRVTVTVPASFGLPAVDSVHVAGTAVTYTDNTGGTRTISIDLDSKLTSTDSIQIYFTADAPTAPDASGQFFTSTVDDSGTGTPAEAAAQGNADGDAGDDNSWKVTTSEPTAVSTATAEIWPNDVIAGTIDNAFVYAILATIGGSDTGVDSIEITVPASFGDPSVNDVRVAGVSVAYTDGTAGKVISLKLATKLTTTDSIQVYFSADAPASPDAGQDVTSKLDDTGTSAPAQSATEGSADGDAGDNNSWTVVTTSAGSTPANLLGRYCFNEAASGTGPTSVADDQSNAVDLSTIQYNGMSWAEVGGHRGLGAASHTGIARGTASGTKYTSTLDGATQASLTLVASWSGGSSDRAFGFVENDGSRVFHILTMSGGDIEFRLQTVSQGIRAEWSGSWDDGTRRVFQFVYDAANSTQSERLRLYVDGVDQGSPSFNGGSWPALNEGLDFSASTIYVVALNEPDLSNPLPGRVFYTDVRDGAVTDAEASSSATELLADDDCGGSGGSGGNAVTSAVAEISPNDVETSSTGNHFIYAILATINSGGGDTGVDRVEIPVPASFGAPTVDSVRVGGASVSFTDNTAGRQISIDLASKLTSTDSIQVYFTSDAPTSADATGQNFTSTVDDTATATAAQASTEGNGDGDAADDNSWTVTTTDPPPAVLLGRYWFNEAPSGQLPATVADDQASPVDLTLTYDTGVEWTVSDGHRGLNGASGPHAGGAEGDATSTKYQTALDGASKASFVVVAEWTNSGATQAIAGFYTSGGARVAHFGTLSNGALDIWLRTEAQTDLRLRWGGTGFADGTRRVFHLVYDSDDTTPANRVRLYVNGVDQGAATLGSGSWPALGEALDMSGSIAVAGLNEAGGYEDGAQGTLFYYAVYDGELTDAEISTDASALAADDDNLTFAVTVTPDGSSVARQVGTEYSFDFTLNNGATVIEDFDLLAAAGPASSFITVDSITGSGIAGSGAPDSARITSVAGGADSTVTVWYSVVISTDGRVDTLYLTGRSLSDTSKTDLGWLEIEFESVSLTVGPDGADTLQLLPSGSNGPSSYKFDITNSSQVSETFDLLASAGPRITIDSVVGPNLSGGSPGDSARTGPIAGAASDSAFVWFSVSVGSAGALDSLYLTGRSVSQPTAADSGWVFVELLQPIIVIAHSVNPTGTQPPGTDLTYTTTITNTGNYDAASVVFVDSLASETEFKVGSVVVNLPVAVSVEYSDDNGLTWTYTPASGGCGATANYDDCVSHIRWILAADFSHQAPNNTGDVEYVARIK